MANRSKGAVTVRVKVEIPETETSGENLLPEDLPEGHGSWDELLRALHRHERESARITAALSDALVRFRRAAQALPDGVLILDRENRIEWCNHTAELHLQIDGRADLGQPIANLVRDPQFVDYLATEEHAAPVRVSRTWSSCNFIPPRSIRRKIRCS